VERLQPENLGNSRLSPERTPRMDIHSPNLVAAETEPVSLDDPMPMTPSAMSYEDRLERVTNLISKIRGPSDMRKVSALHDVA
jgi:hypothetical protein